jgi:hypothetical protein
MDEPFDLAIVLDRSASTSEPSGADVDGDGIIGKTREIPKFFRFFQRFREHRFTDPDDSVLSAEVVGTVNLVRQLKPGNSRVSVLSFSGKPLPYDIRGRPAFSEVEVELPLTSDSAEADMAAYRVLAKGSVGGTNMAAAVRMAVEELTRGDVGRPDGKKPKKLICLLSDGWPSMPAGSPNISDPEDQILTIQAGYLARRAGIKIHTYALGPMASAGPFTLEEVARVTGGRFTPVPKPSEIMSFFEDVNLVYLDSLKVENASLGKPAAQVILGKEGFFIAKVPVEAGVNIVKVTAVAIDGTSGKDTVILRYLEPYKDQEVRDLDLTGKNLDDLKLELKKEEDRFLLLNRPVGEERKALDLKKVEDELKDLILHETEKRQKMELEIEPR